jgi:hypothetical protein
MEFVSQIFRPDEPPKNRPYLSDGRRRKIWETFFVNTMSFPGTKIFRKKMSAQLVPSWGGSNGKRSKRFSSANGAKTEQTVFSWGHKMDGSTFGTLYCVLIARTQGTYLEHDRVHNKVGPLSIAV